MWRYIAEHHTMYYWNCKPANTQRSCHHIGLRYQLMLISIDVHQSMWRMQYLSQLITKRPNQNVDIDGYVVLEFLTGNSTLNHANTSWITLTPGWRTNTLVAIQWPLWCKEMPLFEPVTLSQCCWSQSHAISTDHDIYIPRFITNELI